MAVNQTVRLDVVADTSKYQAAFSKIPGYTDKQAARAAERLVKRLQKAQDQAERDAKAAAKAAADEWGRASRKGGGMGNAADALDNISDKAGEVDSILAGIGGALDSVDPKLGAVARGFGDAAGGMEAVSRAGLLSIPALGAVGVAVAAAGATYLILAHNLEQAEARMKASAALAERMSGAHKSFSEAIDGTNQELEKMLDTFDKEGSAQEMRDRRIRQGAKQQTRAIESVVKSLEQERAAILENERVDETTEARLDSLTSRIDHYRAAIEATNRKRDEALSLSEDITFGQQAEAEATLRAEKAARAKAAADAAAAEAARIRAEEEARQAAQLAAIIEAGEKRNAQIDRELALREKQAALISEIGRAEMTESQRLSAEATNRLNEAETILQQRRENAANDYALRLQAEQEYEEARRLILEDFERQRTEMMAAALDERARLAEREQQMRIDTARRFTETTLSSMSETLSGLSQLSAQAGQGEQARRLFKAAKALNATLTLMSTYQAAQGALLPPPAGFGPVLGPPAAAAITAAGLTRVALIRKQKMPKFYSGTERVDGGASDAVPAVLHQDEAVINRRGAESMGRDRIRQLNETGYMDMGAKIVAVPTLNHRMYRDFYFNDRSMPGSLTRGDRNPAGTRIGRKL